MIRQIKTIECPECGVHFEQPDLVPVITSTQDFANSRDVLVKLGTVETFLSDYFDPIPSRPTIVTWIREGILRGCQMGRGDYWFVYRSSLDDLALKITSERGFQIAA